MLQIWNDNFESVPVTAIEAQDSIVTQVKTLEKDKYEALQLGAVKADEKILSKAQRNHQKTSFAKIGYYLRHLYEIRDTKGQDDKTLTVGDILSCDIFQKGDKITVQSRSAGKGFQGVVKLYNFRGGRASHGSTTHRETGSIGACSYPGEVEKGKKMPRRMGNEMVSVHGLEIADIVPEDKLILVKGAVPGKQGSLVYLKKGLR